METVHDVFLPLLEFTLNQKKASSLANVSLASQLLLTSIKATKVNKQHL